MLHWLENTAVAQTVSNSLAWTAALSAGHLLGFTLATGSAFLMNLRLRGAVLEERPAAEIIRITSRGVFVGVAISILTGAPLFMTRASAASSSAIFQAKMLLLVLATSFQFLLWSRWFPRLEGEVLAARASGIVGIVLWLALAIAGCAFILLE